MPTTSLFHEDLIRRYDKPGPRYTSYPPATEFHDGVDESDFRDWARLSNEEPIPRPLSLYFHIPFCSSICYYCACNKVITKRKEKAEPYLRDVYREIELQSKLFDTDREVRQLHWGGGTPGFLSRQQIQDLMEQTADHFRLTDDANRDYSIEIDPRVMQAGDVAHLRRLGFNRISLGVQDFDDRVQRAVNRVQSIETTAAVIDEARHHGMRSINIDLIYGLPFQSLQSFTRTLATITDLDPDRVAIYNYAHLPHRFPPQRRIDASDLPSADEKLEILRRAVEFLGESGYDYIGMDHFAKPRDELAVARRTGALQRNFQGYSTHAHCDSVGFGVSAISQVQDHFSQNATGLDEYHAALEQGRLPLVRGYQSEPDDLIRRDIIQGLSCHGRLDIGALEARWEIDFESYFADELSRLQEMQDDGLLERDEKSICLNDPGRLLVRNICMVFDRYLPRDRVTPLFSRTL